MRINIVKYLTELLYKHDCVIVPGFGGFIGNYSPASIQPVHHIFLPPSKSLLFNIHLNQNDGFLATCISQAEQIPFDHAMNQIRIMAEEWNRTLETGNVLVIEKVGKIVKETDGTFQFEQDPSFNYLQEAYGLTSLVSPAIRRAGMQEKVEKRIEKYIKGSAEGPGKLKRNLKWAAVIALPIGMAAFLSISHIDQIRNFNANYTGFLVSNSFPPGKKAIQSPAHTHVSKKVVNPVDGVTPSPPSTMGQVNRSETTTPPASNEGTASKPFAVIVGAFQFRENAENLVSKLKQEGFDAGIYDSTVTGLFRVSIGTFFGRDEAIKQLVTVRSQKYSSAWLLSK